MFYVRPIVRDDLPALLALSERSGAALTTLPANADRLAARIARSLASFAGNAGKADECFVFVLVDARNGGVAGISAIEAAVGLAEPWYNYHVGTQVHASRELGGPAYLRLRVRLSEAERQSIRANVWLDTELHAALAAWIDRHYRDRLTADDLGDPALLDKCRRALDELTHLLGLGSVYPFQLAGA